MGHVFCEQLEGIAPQSGAVHALCEGCGCGCGCDVVHILGHESVHRLIGKHRVHIVLYLSHGNVGDSEGDRSSQSSSGPGAERMGSRCGRTSGVLVRLWELVSGNYSGQWICVDHRSLGCAWFLRVCASWGRWIGCRFGGGLETGHDLHDAVPEWMSEEGNGGNEIEKGTESDGLGSS